MRSRARSIPSTILGLMVGLTFPIVIAPEWVIGRETSGRADGFLPPSWSRPSPDGQFYALGTDYLGRPFGGVLLRAGAATMRVALAGTAMAMLGCLALGVLHGMTRSRAVESVIAAGGLGAMAIPEAAVLIAVASAWPRAAPPIWVNLSMVAVLVLAAIPVGARLIAERVRAVNRSGFVAASRASGASALHTFFREVRPHLTEDVAWIAATVLPRFVAIEVGLAYLGVEYRDFEGLGRALSKSFNNLGVPTAEIQLLAAIAAVTWLAILPQIALRWLDVAAPSEALP